MYDFTGQDIDATMDAMMATIVALTDSGSIKVNSYGVSIWTPLKNGQPGWTPGDGKVGFGFREVKGACRTHPEGKHDGQWYLDNAESKMTICNATGLDSHVAIERFPGMFVGLSRAFPWKGAIIDLEIGIGIGVSGGTADQDLMLSRFGRDFAKQLVDDRGNEVLDDARARGADGSPDPTDRFTRG